MDGPDSPMTDDSPQSSSVPLSPPGSKGAESTRATRPQTRNMPINSSSANENGKRPLNHISNGTDAAEDHTERMTRSGELPGTDVVSGSSSSITPQVHEASGYQWTRAEDAPGYSWSNKKAQDEYNRAWDGLVHKDLVDKSNYGDPIELAEQEAAYLASLQQK